MAKTQPTNQAYLNPPHGSGKIQGGTNDIYLPENPKMSGGANTNIYLQDAQGTGGGANDIANPDPAGVAGGANDIYLPENQKIAGGANTNIYLNDNETV
jgi:hypothetical protein